MLSLGHSAVAAALPPMYDCGACMTLQSVGTEHCAVLDSCQLVEAVRHGCSTVCGQLSVEDTEPWRSMRSVVPQLRVSKGLGTREYGTLRVSLITPAHEIPLVRFDYAAPFRYKWKHNALHSSLVTVVPGAETPFKISPTSTASLRLPEQGAGVVGVLIADPCVRFSSIISLVGCFHAKRFKTTERTPALLNAFLKHNDTDYWGVLGDNWYDRDGYSTAKIYEKLELSTLSKLSVAVPGNHDYWILAEPHLGSHLDQYGNGHMQWHAMDTIAARTLQPGSPLPPFNFSVDPSSGHTLLGGNLPSPDNSFFYSQERSQSEGSSQ